MVLILSDCRNFGNCLCLDLGRKCFFYHSQVFHTLPVGSATPYVEPSLREKEWQLYELHKTFAICLIEQTACLAVGCRIKNRCVSDQTHCLKRKWSLLASSCFEATVIFYETYSQKNFSIPSFASA